MEPMFPTPFGQTLPPGQFGMPTAAAPTATPNKQFAAEAPPFVPAQAQSSQQDWGEMGDPWTRSHQHQGRDAWAHYQPGQGKWGHYANMVNTTTEEQTKEINTVLSNLKDKYGGERESFDAAELLSIINSVSVIHKIYHSNAILRDGRE